MQIKFKLIGHFLCKFLVLSKMVVELGTLISQLLLHKNLIVKYHI